MNSGQERNDALRNCTIKIIARLTTLFVAFNSQSTAQFFGGRQNLPGGGSHQQAGFRAGPAWGSLSQSHDRRGFASPITIGGGADYLSRNGHGISGSAAIQPGIGGQGTLRGQVGLLNTPNHHVNAFAQHDRFLSKDLKPFGPQTNSAGVNYANKNGASAFVSGTRTQGFPAQGTVGASIPVYTNKNGGVSVSGQTTFGHGMKPAHQVGVGASFNF
ncbi:hypothetical protein FQA39_LY12479 [Lamprigera yunnana]|nr:hypothetical protein FQA39_LY12479 [Lamprigera yunnana]